MFISPKEGIQVIAAIYVRKPIKLVLLVALMSLSLAGCDDYSRSAACLLLIETNRVTEVNGPNGTGSGSGFMIESNLNRSPGQAGRRRGFALKCETTRDGPRWKILRVDRQWTFDWRVR